MIAMTFTKGSLVRNVHNPELGPGRVTGRDAHGDLVVTFLWRGLEARLHPDNTQLERYDLFGGVPVRCHLDGEQGERDAVVLGTESERSTLRSYRVAIVRDEHWDEAVVAEAELLPLPPASGAPLDLLRAMAWQGPKRLLRRWRLRMVESNWLQSSGGVPAFLGARIRPLGHQLYAARRILWDRVPRFILADEVGLGKTIEAGLVIQSLTAERPELRVLIIAPGSMARQWQTELYLRFGARVYDHVDSTTLANLSRQSARAKLQGPRLVITTTALQTWPTAGEDLVRRDWDLVVIDEAHQFPPGSALYDLFRRLAQRSHGLLALSATPSKREITSLCGLLALVAPDVYAPDDHKALARRLEMQRGVWDRLQYTRKLLDAGRAHGNRLGAEDLADLAGEWAELLEDDPVVTRLVAELRSGREEAGEELVAYVQEFHRLDYRIIRTRRSTLQGGAVHWSPRTLQVIDYDPHTYEAVLANHLEQLAGSDNLDPAQRALRGLYHRFFATTPARLESFLDGRHHALNRRSAAAAAVDPLELLASDPGPADEERLLEVLLASTPELPEEHAWLETALGLAREWASQGTAAVHRFTAALAWLDSHLRASAGHQVLLFAQDRTVVEELTYWLRRELPGVPVRCFHHGMDEKALAQAALHFQRNRDCRVLVCDELGGEGRNFQNASAVLHFDLPWSVARLEQRIGRLDRVGRGTDRPVLSVVLGGPTATENALLALHREVFQVFTRSVGGLEYTLPLLQRQINGAICVGDRAVRELHRPLEERVAQELSDVDEAFEMALDASRLQLTDAQKVADLLAEPDDWQEEGTTLAKWLGKLGIRARQSADHSWEFSWEQGQLQRRVEGLPASGFVTGTFDRQRALADDSQQFFSAGHTLIDAALGDLNRSAEGRATVMSLKLGRSYTGRWFALVLGRCDLDTARLGDTPEPGLLLRARRFLWSEMQAALVELHPGKEPGATALNDATLSAHLRAPQTISMHYEKIPPNTLGQGVDTLDLWAAVEEAIPLGLERIRQSRGGISEHAARELAADLRPELGFLAWQAGRARSAAQEMALQARIEARQRLIEAVRQERVEVEAVAVIFAIP